MTNLLNIGPNPFTPRAGQEPKVFLGRDREIETFLKQLGKTRLKKYDHFVVIGGWGVGKTTLLKEFRKTAQAQKVITSFVSIHEFAAKDLLSPVVHLLSQIPRNLPIKFARLKRFANYLQGVGITFPVVGGGIEFAEKRKFHGDPQVLLLDGMLKLWRELKKEMDALVVFLDDVQNYGSVPEFLGLLKNVLSEDDIAGKTGYLFVLSATEDGWSKFLEKNHPIGRYFIPILRIENLSKKDTLLIIDAVLKGTGVEFENSVKEAVYEYTEGHPFQMQVLCSYLFDSQLKGKVGSAQLEGSLVRSLDELGPILLDPLLKLASEQEKTILEAMSAKYRIYSFDELVGLAKGSPNRISKGTLAAALARLTNKGILLKTERGKYRMVNRMFSEFLSRQ